MVGGTALCDHRNHRERGGSLIATPISQRPAHPVGSSTPDTRPGRLVRSRDERVVAGVAGGIAEWLGLDPWVVRVAFVVLAAAGAVGVVVYGVLWAVLPTASTEMRRRRPASLRVVAGQAHRVASVHAARGQRVLAVGLLALGLLLLARELGLWFSDRLVWPLTLAAVGLTLVWPQRAGRDLVPLRRAALLRVMAGVVVVAAGAALFAATNADFETLQDSLAAAVLTIAGVVLIFGPWWWRLGRDLFEERRRRIRSEERAEVAARVHDSVLQTLALIQQQADDPTETARLARRQERELRSWLFEDGPPRAGTLRSAVRAVADEIEDVSGVAVDQVVVGDCATDDRTEAVVAAAREALLNAAKFSGEQSVSLYVEVEPEKITAYVRDRGTGFDIDQVPADRQGIRESIIGRMKRHGGRANLRSDPDGGTEVELVMPRAHE